jgi:hypothetical protein
MPELTWHGSGRRMVERPLGQEVERHQQPQQSWASVAFAGAALVESRIQSPGLKQSQGRTFVSASVSVSVWIQCLQRPGA